MLDCFFNPDLALVFIVCAQNAIKTRFFEVYKFRFEKRYDPMIIFNK